MAGRHSAPYTRYPNAGTSYGNNNMGNSNISNNNNLNIPFPPQNNGSMGMTGGGGGSGGNGPYSSASGSSYSTTPTNMTSPYSSASSPGYHSPNVSKTQHNVPLKKYVLQPPPKLLPYCKSTPSLGYPGMFPQRPNQEEDIMSESNMRNGFVDKAAVSNEQTCAHDIIFGKLQDDQRLLNEMGSFMVDVLKRKRKASRITGPTSFRPPQRNTLMELKKEQWIQDLANGAIPLRKLSRNVPHGYKSEKLLETLAARQVPFLRATWFIKVVGLSEMTQRNVGNPASSSSYAYSWTGTVTAYLKKQITDLAPLPSNNAGGSIRGYRNSNVPGVGGGSNDNQVRPWATAETRARFEARWAYSSKLTRWQYSEGLLDQRNFLKWSLYTLASSGSFEMMWLVLTGLVQDYIDEYRRNRTLTKLLIETLIKAYSALLQCSKFSTSDPTASTASNSSNVLIGLKRDIERMIQSLFLSSPDMFVIPKLYHQYRHIFEMILGEQARVKLVKTVPDICSVMDAYWTMVKARNEVFCGSLEENRLGNGNNNMIELSTNKSATTPVTNASADLTNSDGTSEGAGVDEEHIVHTLDTIGRYADSGYLLFASNNDGWTDAKGHSALTASSVIFGGCTNGDTVHTGFLNQVIQILCRWATCEARHGDWRAFLVSSILLCWRDQDQNSYSKRQSALQEALMEFLDDQVLPTSWTTKTDTMSTVREIENQVASTASMVVDDGSATMDGTQSLERSSTASISFLYDTFIRMQLFSYHRYLNRLTARGYLERSQRNRPDVVRCLYHLRSLPLLTPAPAHLVNQRRVALYGTRRDNDSESQLERNNIEQLQLLAKQWIMGYTSTDTSGQQNNKDDTTLFGMNAGDMTEPMVNDTAATFELSLSDKLEHQMRQLMDNSTRYVIVQFTSEWLANEVKRFVVKNVQIGEDNWRVMTSPGSCLLNARQYVAIIKILECAKDYMNIVQVALWVLEKTNESSVLALVIDTLRQYANIWKLMNFGNQTTKTLWDKHQSLQARGIRERCVMIYMVQLIQEGYSVTDDMRLQLQKDLQMRPKVRGRHVQVSIVDELFQVINNDASKSSVQNAVETLCAAYQYQNGALWVGLVLDGMVDVIQQWIKKTTMYGSNDQEQLQQQQKLTLQRYLCAFANIIKDIADICTLTGQISDALIDWLSTKGVVVEEMRQPQSWLALFIAHLVSRNLASLDVIFYRFTLPWFDQVSQHFLQDDTLWSTTNTTAATDGPSANASVSNNDSSTGNNDTNNQWLHICENMMILIRLLVVQERCYWIQQDDNAINEVSGAYQQPWVLPADEVFRLETLRHTQLASSLDRIEPMFALMEKLVLIASSLPLSSPLLQELVMLRADLLQIGWFRQACVRDLHGVYRRFSSHGAEASTEKKIKKKILSIVDELIGGTLADMNPGHHHHHHLHHAALVQELDFIDKIQRIFANVSQWNEEQCRVQVSLLLDNILLSDGGNGQNFNNPHILGGDDITVTSSNDKPEHSDEGGFLTMKKNNNKDLDAFVRFFFGVVLSNEDQQQRRSLFFKNVIHGLRKRVLLELLNYGVRLLEGGCGIDINDGLSQQDHGSTASPSASQQQQQQVQSPDQNMSSSSSSSPPIMSSTGSQQQQRIAATSTPSPAHSSTLKSFPNNVLLLSSADECFDSSKYGQKSQAFFNIMQHMMAQNMWENDKKIDLIKTLYRQINRFQSGFLAYQVMQDAHTTYAQAVAALNVTKNNVASAVTLLATEGSSLETTDASVTLEDLRTSLLIRIRLVVPYASLIWEYPKSGECDALSWIETLVILLGNPIVHGNGSQEQFFEFVLDLVTLIIDEVPQVLRKDTLNLLSRLHGEPTTMPAMFQSRINRILPFSTHNIYLTNSRLATGIIGATPTTDPSQQQQHVEACMEQSRPWEWLEDYVSDPPHDNDVPINLGLFRARKSRRMEGTYIRCRT